MLNLLFIIFIFVCLGYLFYAERKEVPLVILLHTFIQYIITVSLWFLGMTPTFTGLMLGFLVISTLLLIWGRNLVYSKELQSINMLFSMIQWIVIIGVLVFSTLGSPYYQMVPTSGFDPHINLNTTSIHPIIKLSGNVLLFTFFFQIITNWGEKWTLKKSAFNMLPLIFLFVLLGILKFLNSDSLNGPFA